MIESKGMSKSARSKLTAIQSNKTLEGLWRAGYGNVSALYALHLLCKEYPESGEDIIIAIRSGRQVSRRNIEAKRKRLSSTRRSTQKEGGPSEAGARVFVSISGMTGELDLAREAEPGYVWIRFKTGDRGKFLVDEVQLTSVKQQCK